MASYDSVCGARWHISPKQRKDGGPWGDPPSRNLEVDTQAEFHLPRGEGLILDDAPLTGRTGAGILIQTRGRVGWLEVVEDVRHQGINADAHALTHLGLFGNGQVHIPLREAANAARAPHIAIHTEDWPPKMAVHRLRVAIGIQSRGVAAAASATRGHAIMRRHARDGANQHGVFVGRVRTARLAKGLAIAVDV